MNLIRSMQYRRAVLILTVPTLLVFAFTIHYFLTKPLSQPFASYVPKTSSRPEQSASSSTTFIKPYTRTLVISKSTHDDTLWVDNLVAQDPNLGSAVYTVDDNTTATLSVPDNKGHEAMVYLTYIIDHYDSLSDVSIFMRAQQNAWYNNDILNGDSANIVRHLRSQHVILSGYMNLRCHQEPGCPDYIHPGAETENHNNNDNNNKETPLEPAVLRDVWAKLYPGARLPDVLSQPCCGQFAVSAQRIRTVTQRRYIELRDWLLTTELDDDTAARLWEYTWQWLFTGHSEYCPSETTCYCDGYGICFGAEDYRRYYEYRREALRLEADMKGLKQAGGAAVADMAARIQYLHGRMDEIKERVVT
ncbi:hypothetical protein P168DRAFT_293465 [Aspergillus campestris IBT 28561]|uniref:Uncharacterized protein n=1 Tax=Aspergillus campestris (strain IBT 28561) TaxID=1392248 RepID=A0A2I1CSK8_ASPC2|nr:uncharacterized protein P168DRAFT_293465 [Aspergillus campestris IBT 28561]PKY00612.1 hypothetical protein P168DRAFT_293465 [Aspergillus campestris IBT 28561]